MRYTVKWTKGALSSDDKQVFVAVDHGLSFPSMPHLERPLDVLRRAAQCARVDGVIATPGLYRTAAVNGLTLAGINRLVTVDCVKVSADNHLITRAVLCEPDEMDGLSPDCYKMFLNVYQDESELTRNLRDVARMAAAGRKRGISCIAEIMLWNNPAAQDPHSAAEAVYQGSRMAMELGADCLKIPMLPKPELVNQLIDSVGLPTFILGGARVNGSDEMTRFLQAVRAMDVCGVMLGRNIWQSEDMDKTLQTVRQGIRP